MHAPAPTSLPECARDESRRVCASLDVEFAFDPVQRATVLSRSHQQAPLQIVRAFKLADGAALVHLHNISGGLLSGDELRMNCDVHSAAAAQITTTGATRVYRSADCGHECVQTNTITIAEGALLEYVPDPIIPFAHARLRQRTTIHLAANAGLFWWDILAPGREARGEVFAYDCVEMQTEVIANGTPIAIDHVCLEPGRRDVISVARLGAYRYWTTFYICRVGDNPRQWLSLEAHLRAVMTAFATDGDARWAVSTLANDGLVVRGASLYCRDAISGLQEIWRAAKRVLYGRESIPPRKIH